MNSSRDDLIELSDHAWRRLLARLAGLSDEEYGWQPVPAVTTLKWRLAHITVLLLEDRNGPWLGVTVSAPTRSDEPGTAAEAVAALVEAYAFWRIILERTTEESLAQPIGALAGRYAQGTRRSFALHVLDELIHHGAEVALMRDLYAAAG